MHMQFADFPYLSAILISCVAGLLVILMIPPERSRTIRQVSATFSGIPLILSLWLFFAYDKKAGGLQFVEKIMWVPSLGITYFNGADGFSLPMLLLTGIVFFTGVLTMWELEYRVKEFFALIFLMVTGVFGMFMALDLFFIFVWYDVSLFPMYLLIAIWGSTRKEYGAMKLTLYLLAGSALILPGILYLVVTSGLGTFDLVELMYMAKFTPFQQRFAFILFYIGFGILAGVWPFHTWSPVGHVAAPTAVSMIHAGVLMKIGAFGVLRVGLFLCPEGWQYWAPLMALLATIGIVYGAFAGLGQTDLKFCIGYSSVSHMGIVGLGLATVTVDGLSGAVFQMFAHGVMTALFFSSVGYIYDRTHTKMIPELGGLARTMPVATTYFVIAALTGIGVPCLASFWAELMVFIASFRVYPLYGTLAVCGLVVSALFMLRVVQNTCYGPENEKFGHLPDIPFGPGIPRMILVSVIVLFGLFPSLMFEMIQTASIPFIDRLLP
ncbi:NADH dehydrogenase [Desulfonema ishimotonii]|uniref:NADH dehydrogenase n=1 Tax=Desulfonema ishimotonii TaxID=45657 RepID=A0A401G058_9BACT|nr:NADH-quinone oxidoreductase subunit M [Desulfonema ishimotonii]GBC62609.1 NADH dehydrogenase [Desulfonema ishimotonii]